MNVTFENVSPFETVSQHLITVSYSTNYIHTNGKGYGPHFKSVCGDNASGVS